MVKLVKIGNEMKSNMASVPWSCLCERFISVTKPAELQVMPVQLPWLSRLVSDQELSTEDRARLFLHFTRASPSLLVDTELRPGSKKRKKRKRR